MNFEAWKNIILHLFILCGVRKMTESEHALYITSMYKELKDKFNDNEIQFAARQIAENENLYGNYPPLSVWLKYCKFQKLKKSVQETYKKDLLCFVNDIITCDEMMYCPECLKDDFNKYKAILVNFGINDLTDLRRYKYASDYEKEELIKKISKDFYEIEPMVELLGNNNKLLQ